MTSKANERKGPWQQAAVAALQGASIEEQLGFLDPDLVEVEDVPALAPTGPGLGLGALPVTAPAAARAAAPDDRLAEAEAVRTWGRWDAHGRGRIARP